MVGEAVIEEIRPIYGRVLDIYRNNIYATLSKDKPNIRNTAVGGVPIVPVCASRIYRRYSRHRQSKTGAMLIGFLQRDTLGSSSRHTKRNHRLCREQCHFLTGGAVMKTMDCCLLVRVRPTC